jgi:hypothetical protein
MLSSKNHECCFRRPYVRLHAPLAAPGMRGIYTTLQLSPAGCNAHKVVCKQLAGQSRLGRV